MIHNSRLFLGTLVFISLFITSNDLINEMDLLEPYENKSTELDGKYIVCEGSEQTLPLITIDMKVRGYSFNNTESGVKSRIAIISENGENLSYQYKTGSIYLTDANYITWYSATDTMQLNRKTMKLNVSGYGKFSCIIVGENITRNL